MGTGNWFIGSIHTGSRLGSIHKRSMDTSSICGWSMSIRESSMGISDSRGNSLVGDSRNIGKSSRDITISIVDGLDNRSRGNLSGENLLNSVGFSLSFPLAIIMHRRTMGTGNLFIGSIHTGSRLGSIHKRNMDTSSICGWSMSIRESSTGRGNSLGVGDRGNSSIGVSDRGKGSIVVSDRSKGSIIVSNRIVGVRVNSMDTKSKGMSLGNGISLRISLSRDKGHQASNNKRFHTVCSGVMSTTVPMLSHV